MNQSEKKMKDFFSDTAKQYICMYLILVIWNAVLPYGNGDDTFFDIELGTNAFKNITAFLKMRYLSWSSRIIIEGLMVLATKLPHAIWIILNAGIMLLMIFLMLEITGNKERNFGQFQNK